MPTASCAIRAAVVLAVGTICFRGPAFAQEVGLSRCLAIADVAERVACYDAIAQAEQRASGSSAGALSQPAPAPTAPTDVEPAPSSEENFGLSAARVEAIRPAQDRAPDSVEYAVTSAEIVGAGYWQFVTEEGPVWRLAARSRAFRAPRRGDTFTVRKGRLGSFYLESDRQPSIRVVRIM